MYCFIIFFSMSIFFQKETGNITKQKKNKSMLEKSFRVFKDMKLLSVSSYLLCVRHSLESFININSCDPQNPEEYISVSSQNHGVEKDK